MLDYTSNSRSGDTGLGHRSSAMLGIGVSASASSGTALIVEVIVIRIATSRDASSS
jgi:hypothetical protein